MKISKAAVAQLVTRAITEHQAGNLVMAEALYIEALESQPRHFDALHFLGMILHGKADPVAKAEGRKLVEKSLKISVGNPIFLNNLATIYLDNGDLPNALRICQQVIAIKPSFTRGYYTQGLIYRGMQRFEESKTSFLKAIQLDSNYAEAHSALGLTYVDQALLDEAISAFRAALAVDPHCYTALVALGRVLQTLSFSEESQQVLLAAIKLRPDVADNYAFLSQAQLCVSKFQLAKISVNMALSIAPKSAIAWSTLMHVNTAMGLHEEVTTAFNNMDKVDPQGPTEFSNYLLAKLYDPDLSPEQLFQLHLDYARRFETPRKPFWLPFPQRRDTQKRIRIGYVSGDFRNHVIANFIAPILEHHDHTHFEVYCYYNHPTVDAHTKKIRAFADVWTSTVQMNPEQLAEHIRKDGIDILIDLSGHTGYNALPTFLLKPAPVLVTWLGYAATTGLAAMDYRITDANLDPPGVTDEFHTERLLRLKSASAAFQPHPESPPTNALPALTNGFITFACLNVSKKINQAVVACWAKILAAIPSARLIICGTSNEVKESTVLTLFIKNGVSPERLILQPHIPLLEFLALLYHIDIALDPFPYNGGTTSLHAAWMGVPIITWPQRTTVSNVGAAVLRPLGLEEFIVHSEAEYVQKAVDCAQDFEHLATIRASMRDRMTKSIGVTPREITAEVEGLYRTIWQKWCEENPLA